MAVVHLTREIACCIVTTLLGLTLHYFQYKLTGKIMQIDFASIMFVMMLILKLNMMMLNYGRVDAFYYIVKHCTFIMLEFVCVMLFVWGNFIAVFCDIFLNRSMLEKLPSFYADAIKLAAVALLTYNTIDSKKMAFLFFPVGKVTIEEEFVHQLAQIFENMDEDDDKKMAIDKSANEDAVNGAAPEDDDSDDGFAELEDFMDIDKIQVMGIDEAKKFYEVRKINDIKEFHQIKNFNKVDNFDKADEADEADEVDEVNIDE